MLCAVKFEMMSKKLKYYGGQGYGYSKETGKFEVKAKVNKTFDRLSEAKAYYESLNEEKAIWDLTTIPELIECHTY
jgi:hypothetical protein